MNFELLKMTYKGKTITRHARGNWFVRVQFNNKIINIYGKTQLETYEKLKIVADKIEIERSKQVLGKLTEPSVIVERVAEKKANTYTLKTWFDEWLNSYKVGNVRAVTIDGFKRDFRMVASLHNVELNKITNIMLTKTINAIKSYRQRDKADNLFKQMFKTAFYNKVIETNPALNLPRPKQYALNEKKAFTQEQEKVFVDACLKNLELYEPLIVCVLQGLRKGELLALRPNDFDFEKNTLRIDESYDHEHPNDLQTKNATSNRIMPMFETTKQVLLRYKNSTTPRERIYESFGHSTVNNRLEKLLKQIDLPKMCIHELRHTFISRCHEKGIDEIIVQKWVGHAIGSRMTKAVYTHVASEQEQKYIDLLNENK